MAQTGLIAKWKKDELTKLDAGRTIEEKKTLSITLEHTQAAFFIILIGYSASSIVFGIEILIGYSKQQNAS